MRLAPRAHGPRRTQHLLSCAVACLAAVTTAACGGGESTPLDASTAADAPTSDARPSARNACGGRGTLDAIPGDACGPCERGVVVCDGADTTRCAGEGALDACGGCDVLPGGPGDACGVCGDGALACATDGLACEGASDANACGGCEALTGAPGDACDASGVAGRLACQGPDVLACIPEGANVCGGASALDAAPGTPCGACDLGVWACDGTDALTCLGENDGLNECGGCGALAAEIGSACGACGGAYACDPGGFVACVDETRNACGGCGELAGAPGDRCAGGEGVLACVGGALECVEDADNGCGGTTTLTGTPGEACGDCGDGLLVCAGLDALACEGASPTNACGGCGLLVGVPGEACGAPGYAWACAGDALACEVADPDAVVALALDPSTLALAPGADGELVARARLADGRTVDVSADATWESADEAIARVAAGTVTGVSAGTTDVTARYMGFDASAEVSVAAVTAITIAPASASTPLGVSVDFTATATFEDGSSADVTASAAWSSSDASVASVAAGVATPLATGATTIAAALGGASGDAALTVTPAEIVSITVTPGSVSLAAGRTEMLSASASYTDGTSADVTSSCAWTSSDASIASVASGLVMAEAVGTATVTCVVGSASGPATVMVTAAELESIAITPAAPSLFVDDTAALTATGTYSDGSTADLSASASWSSSSAAVASVDASGLVTAVAAGSTTITATQDGISGTADVTVRSATLVSITIAPATASVAAGLTQAFTAEGSFDDGSSADLTGSVTWESTATATATIASTGVATGVAAGTTTIRASLDGVSDTAVLTVTPPELVGIEIAPTTLTLDAGEMGSLTATARWTDGTTTDATADATWTTTDASIASVAAGTVRGESEGTATISASYMGAGASAEITVLPPALVSLTIESAGPIDVDVGVRIRVHVVATFSDGSMRDVTTEVAWTSSATAIASVAPGGWATALTSGTATLTASLGGQSVTTMLRVSADSVANVGVESNAVVFLGDAVASVGVESNAIVFLGDAIANVAASPQPRISFP